MRQLTYVSPGLVEWRDVPTPKLQDARSAIVRPLAVTRCDLDYLIVTGATGWNGPFALGHETVGEVVDVGDGVEHFAPGDRVIVPFQISCGVCRRCLSGKTGNCEGVPFRSSYGMAPLSGVDYGGALSDLLRVPFADHMLVSCPSEISSIAAAGIADNVSDAYRGIAMHLAAYPNARVLVVGGLGQGIGIYSAQAALSLGVSEVLYADDDGGRLELAKRVGVTTSKCSGFDGVAQGAPYELTVDASGKPEGLAFAIRSTAQGGVCHRTYGDLHPTTPVPLRDMYGIGVSLQVGRVHARAAMPEVVDRVRRGSLRPELAVTRTASFAEASEAIFDKTIKLAFINEW